MPTVVPRKRFRTVRKYGALRVIAVILHLFGALLMVGGLVVLYLAITRPPIDAELAAPTDFAGAIIALLMLAIGICVTALGELCRVAVDCEAHLQRLNR